MCPQHNRIQRLLLRTLREWCWSTTPLIANVAQLVEHIHGGVKKTLAHNVGNNIVNPE